MSNQLKCVRVSYVIDDCFKIPKHINLEDETQVSDWGVKYNVLNIYLTNGEKLKIESEGWIHSFDYKYPSQSQDMDIVDASEVGIDDDDEDEEVVEKVVEKIQDEYGHCSCGTKRHKNDIFSHGVADGVCCECKECHSEKDEPMFEDMPEEEYIEIPVKAKKHKKEKKEKKSDHEYIIKTYDMEGKYVGLYELKSKKSWSTEEEAQTIFDEIIKTNELFSEVVLIKLETNTGEECFIVDEWELELI